MKKHMLVTMSTHLALVLCLVALGASAQVRRSSRNIKPLTQQQRERSERSMMGNSAMTGQKGGGSIGVAPANPAPDMQKEKVKYIYNGPESGWGFLTERMPYYAPDGKNLGKLPAGTLFKFKGKKETAVGTLLVSTYKTEDGKWAGPFLFSCTKIATYEGDPDTVDPEMVGRLQSYFTLGGQIADRKSEIEEERKKRNPHLEPARQAQQNYRATLEKATALEKEMNATTGLRRSKLQDQLRTLKYEQSKIKTKADEIMKQYNAWKAAHPIDPAVFTNDPTLRELEEKRNATGVKVKD